jgi:hypothetical protein
MERAALPGTPEAAEPQPSARVGTRLRAASRSGRDSPVRPGQAGLLGLLRRVPGWVLAGVVYAAAAVVMWWQVWAGHPTSEMTCACGDPSSFVWYLAWPAYAISHGHSLFFSSRVHVPGGVNLLDNTSVLALGVVLAPVTWLFGPIATLNVALTAAPVLTGLSAYAALRRGLGVGRPAAFLGGLAFAFSPFMLRNEAINHLQTSFLALVPLIFWCCYELAVAQRGRWWRWGVVLGLLVAVQFFVGSEVLTVTVLITAIALALGLIAAWLHEVRNPDDRALSAKLPFALQGFGVAAVVGIVLLAYPLWFATAGPGHILGADWGRPHQGALGLVLWPLGGTPGYLHSWKLAGYLGPIGTDEGYLGIPALAILAIAVVVVRRPLTKLCAAVTVIAVWLSLGSVAVPIRQGGEPKWLPLVWRAFAHLPVLNKLSPGTFALASEFCTVVAGVLLADELLRRRRESASGAGNGPAVGVAGALSRLSVGQATATAGAVCLALVVPWLLAWQLPLTTHSVTASPWAARVGTQLPANAVVLFYPFPATYQDQAVIWQAQSGMRYSIVGGRGIAAGQGNVADHGFTPGTPEGTMSALTTLQVPQSHLTTPPMPNQSTISWFRSALQHWGVTDVVVTAGGSNPGYAVRWLRAVMGTAPQREDGAWVWTSVQRLIS